MLTARAVCNSILRSTLGNSLRCTQKSLLPAVLFTEELTLSTRQVRFCSTQEPQTESGSTYTKPTPIPGVAFVSGQSAPGKVAGYLLNKFREGDIHTVRSRGAPGNNQAVKTMAALRRYTQEPKEGFEAPAKDFEFQSEWVEESSIETSMKPRNEPLNPNMQISRMEVHDTRTAGGIAGFIACRLREGKAAELTAMGSMLVSTTLKGIALSRKFLAEQNMDCSYQVQFVTREPLFPGEREYTMVQFLVYATEPASSPPQE